ncbi:MAG: TRAP transporter substrate-binding protein DctP [Deltaproteobacteria bacterium]|nr:TRAP transporter substrate-binding protein DctP [Deltaproteobacteria bacterium]
MHGHTLIKSAVLCIVALMLCIPSIGSAQEVTVIKIATLAPDGSSWMKTLNAINAEVMEKTKGKVVFKIYPGGVLGDEKDMMRKMQIGQIQGAGLSSGGLAQIYKEIDVIHIPFFLQNYEEVDYVLKKMGPYFKKGLEDNGYILLGWSEAGFTYLLSTVYVSSVDDLKKAKVWIWQESPMAKAIFHEAGVAAIPLSLPDVLVGLQTGLVDVVYSPPTVAIALQWFTKVKYLVDVPLSYIGGGLVVKKDIFKKLPQSSQTIIFESFQRNLDQLKTITRRENQEAIKVMQNNGVKIVTAPQDTVAEFKRLSEKALSRFTNQTFSPKALADATAILANHRKGRR